jgi:hypothetical protein
MWHAGLDVSRRRLDVCLLDEAGELVAQTAAPPDADRLRHLAECLRGQPGAGGDRVSRLSQTSLSRTPSRSHDRRAVPVDTRFVHDTLEERGCGWEV